MAEKTRVRNDQGTKLLDSRGRIYVCKQSRMAINRFLVWIIGSYSTRAFISSFNFGEIIHFCSFVMVRKWASVKKENKPPS